MKCPICDKNIQDYIEDYTDHILMEEHANCKDENHFYQYEYVTGNTRETINDVTFTSHHADSKEERMLRSRQFRAVLEIAKEFYESN